MRFVNTKTIIPLVIIVVLSVVIKNIVSSILSLRQNSRIVTSLSEEEQKEKRRREFLKQQLFYVKTNEFVEQQAREKLGMTKEGEYVVLEPVKPQPKKILTVDTTPNWKKWWNLFF